MNGRLAARAIRDPVVVLFLDRIRAHRSRIVRLRLFGSRARDDWRPDSDLDIFVIVPTRDRELVERLCDAVIDVLLETGCLISLKTIAVGDFRRLSAIPTPFLANVMAEGVDLGFGD